MTTFYKKSTTKVFNKFLRYEPVSEYDPELLDALPEGSHLVTVKPGSVSKRYKIDTDFAPMIAIGIYAEDAMAEFILKQADLVPKKPPATMEQIAAWNKLVKVYGDDLNSLRGISTHDIIKAGVEEMVKQADKLLSNPTVRKSYENFLLVCKLSIEEEEKNK